MISLIETEKPKPEKSETNSEDKDEDMKEAPAAPPTESKSQSGSGTEENPAEKPKRPSLPNLKKLSDEDCSTLLHACVGLMGLPVDAYALNAILRLLLRLTRTFDYAVIFAQMGGVKMLLDLTQASSFSGIIFNMDFL